MKWPNDLLVGGAKASGILLEGIGGGTAVAMGLGVNIAAHPDDTPYTATHLAAHAPGLDRAAFFARLANHLSNEIDRFETTGFQPLRRRWLARAAHLGQRIAVRREDRVVEGLFLDIDEDGRLLLDADGAPVRIDAGDVFPLDKASHEAQEHRVIGSHPPPPAASIA